VEAEDFIRQMKTDVERLEKEKAELFNQFEEEKRLVLNMAYFVYF